MHDRCQVNVGAIDVREIGICFVENQRQLRSGKHDGFCSFAPAKRVRDGAKLVVMFLGSAARIHNLHICLVNAIDLIGPRHHDIDAE